jgi:hypothetical protein
MVNDLGPRTAQAFVAFLLTGGLVAGSGQTLSRLTVPAAELPNGCALNPSAPKSAPTASAGVTVTHGAAPQRFSFPTNPWAGVDRKLVAAVHMEIDATLEPPLPDRPPTTARESAASELKWADDILEAYHAAYTSPDGHQVEVFAVTFNDIKLATPPPPDAMRLTRPGLTRRLVHGATVIRVSAPIPNGCFEPVRAYIESLK